MKTRERSGTVVHALSTKDAVTVAAMRSTLEPHRGQLQGTEARQPYDAIMDRVVPAEELPAVSMILSGAMTEKHLS